LIGSALIRNSPDRVFESLYRRHVAEIYRYSLAMLDRQADAEDATQTTFMNAYRALERGDQPRSGGAWLRAIALNVCREHYRRASRRPDEVSLDEDPGDLVLDPPTPEIGDVMRGLSCLPFNQRAALVMREFEGRSLGTIAAELGVSVSAVETLLFRARRALREQLEGALTCDQAEHAISRQLDDALPRSERGPLRAHLRECGDCASLARRLRAQRRAIRSIGALIPLPASLKLSAGAAPAPPAAAAAAAAGGSAAVKLGVATLAGVAALGLGYASLHRHGSRAPSAVRGAAALTGTPATAAAAASAGTAESRNPAAARAGPGGGARHRQAAGHRGRTRSSKPLSGDVRAQLIGAPARRVTAPTTPGNGNASHGTGSSNGNADHGSGRGSGHANGRAKPHHPPARTKQPHPQGSPSTTKPPGGGGTGSHGHQH
jgi:RNA polymerase sigma factor (sigma-70 family)